MSQLPEGVHLFHNYLHSSRCQMFSNVGDSLQDAGLLCPFGHQSWTKDALLVANLVDNDAILFVNKMRAGVPELRMPDLLPDHGIFARLKTGGRHALHADAYNLDNTPNHTPHRRMVALLYLGSEAVQFRGGYIKFPLLQWNYRPRIGDLLCFPSHVTYRHEVSPVESGTRDSLAFWYR